MLLTVVVVGQISFPKTYDFYKYITTMTLTVYYLLEFLILTSIHSTFIQYSEMIALTSVLMMALCALVDTF